MHRILAPTGAIRQVWIWSIVVGAYSCLAVWKEHSALSDFADFPAMMDAAMSLAIWMLLVFRINRAYERWWEARTQWGTLVNASRNLAVKYKQYADPDPGERGKFRDLIVGFSATLQTHLTTVSNQKLHQPSFVADQIFAELNRMCKEQRISSEQLWMLDQEARILLDVCGACERIRDTLIPMSFAALVRQFLVIYLLLLPWGLVDALGYLTIPVTMVMVYFTVSAETVATYIEEPFGDSEDHLDLDAIVAVIGKSVSGILEVEFEQG